MDLRIIFCIFRRPTLKIRKKIILKDIALKLYVHTLQTYQHHISSGFCRPMKIDEMRTQSKIEGSDEGSGDRENAVKGHNFENSK